MICGPLCEHLAVAWLQLPVMLMRMHYAPRCLQVVHHLFPNVCHTHYPAIAPIVLDTCREFGIPYIVFPTVRCPMQASLQWPVLSGTCNTCLIFQACLFASACARLVTATLQ